MTGTDVAERDSAELALAAQEDQLRAGARAALDQETIRIPLLVLVQGTTKDPPEGARPGEFFNSVTGENFGDTLDFIVAGYHRGRFYTDPKTKRGYPAGEDKIVPDFWPEEFRGKVFTDLPESEERYKDRVNAEEIEWGSGPPISTTYVFTGFVDGTTVPVRLSLMRTGRRTADKIITLLRALRVPWDKQILLTTKRTTNRDNQPFYVVEAAYGEPVSGESRAQAVQLAQALQSTATQTVGAEALAEGPPSQPPADPEAPGF